MSIKINLERPLPRTRLVSCFTRASNWVPAENKVLDTVSGLSVMTGPKMVYIRGDVVEGSQDYRGYAINLGFSREGGAASFTREYFTELRQAIADYYRQVESPHVGLVLEGTFNVAPSNTGDGSATVFGRDVVVLEIVQALPINPRRVNASAAPLTLEAVL